MADTLLSASRVFLQKKDKCILRGVELEIRTGEITTLIGPNGAGKTSLVRCLLGLDRPTSGSITRQPGLRIGYVPQKVAIPHELPLRVRDFLTLSGRVKASRLGAMLDELEIGNLADSPVQSISGGELQRVLLVRALLNDPQLLVLDEPAQGLDVIGQQSLYGSVATIRDRHACAVLMVSHDLHLVMAATDRVICLNSHVCCTGHPDDVSAHPEYLKLFGSAMDGLAVYAHHHDHEHDVHGNIIREGEAGVEAHGCGHD